jgi:hypothetical protein
MATNGELMEKRGKSRIMTRRRHARRPLPQPQEVEDRGTFSRLEVGKKQEYVDGNQDLSAKRADCEKGSLSNTFFDIAHCTTTSLPMDPPKSAVVEDWIRLANVDEKTQTRAAGSRARWRRVW